jgi:hypothetical protein
MVLLIITVGVGAILFENLPQPNSSPLPSSTPLSSSYPTPTNTATSTNQQLPTNTAISTSTPLPAGTFQPTDSPLPTIAPSPTGNITQITVLKGNMAKQVFNGIHYLFHYTTANTVLVESGGRYMSIPVNAGNIQSVFNIQVAVSEVNANNVILSISPA